MQWVSAQCSAYVHYHVPHTKSHLHPLLCSTATISCIYSKHWINSQSTTLLLWIWGEKSEPKQLSFLLKVWMDAVVAPGWEGLPHSSIGRTTPPLLWQPWKQLLFISFPWELQMWKKPEPCESIYWLNSPCSLHPPTGTLLGQVGHAGQTMS